MALLTSAGGNDTLSLYRQLDKEKLLGRILAVFLWFSTLLCGAGLGVLIQQVFF
jgi:hypothetical protein